MSDRALAWTVRTALALPFVVALVALATTHWTPVLDLAMTEFRVRDVFGPHTPLIGLPGRIGKFPQQGSHPGPLSFYLLAPVYRLLGSRAFAMLAGTAVINVGAAWTAVWVAQRRGGRRLILGVGAFMMVAMAWLGASVLTQPWNPYLPLVGFIAVLLCAWGVLDGDHRLLVPLVGFATLCAQTHVPYLSLCVAYCALGLGAVGWRWYRARAVPANERRSVLAAVALGAVLWSPVFLDEIRHQPGNITLLRRHFLSPPEAPVGISVGVKTILAHFDVLRVVTGSANRSSDFLARLTDLAGGHWQIGAIVLLAWVASAIVSRRLADRRIAHLHVVVAIGSLVAVMSTARIFGKVWYYLTLWSWSIALLAVAATGWTALAWWETRGHRRLPFNQIAVALTALWAVAFVVDGATVKPPEDRLSRSLGAVVGPTAAALDAGTGAADGHGGTYAVVWADSYYFGSQGYGLISELERRGFHARGYEPYHVPITPQRITDASRATAEVVLVTGVNIPLWKAKPNVVQVADFEPRSANELAEFDRLHREAIATLAAAGLDDLAAMVDTNLFGASVDPRLPPGVESKLARLLVLGEETAVFVAPAGTF